MGAALFFAFYIALITSTLGLNFLASQGVAMGGWQQLALAGLVAVLFGLWPDVDTNSKGQDIFYAAFFILDIFLILSHQLEAAAYVGLIAMLPILGKHRGWTHSLPAVFLVPLPLLLVPTLYNQDHWQAGLIYYGAAVVGYFSHLFFDGLIVPWIRGHQN